MLTSVCWGGCLDHFLSDRLLEEAEAEFRERVRLRSEDALRAYVGLGVIAWHQGDIETGQQSFKKALEVWDKALERRLQPMSGLLVNKAIALLGLKRKDEALKTLQEALQQLLPWRKPEEFRIDFELLEQAPQSPEGVQEALRMLGGGRS